MARRKSINGEDQAPPLILDPEMPTADSDSPVRRRRRRRTTSAAAPDFTQETSMLVEATLKSRGAKGATPDVLQNVVNWARSIRSEAEELRVLASRPRRVKTQAPNDRVTRYEVNRALLDGVLDGAIVLDVSEDGELTFVHSAYASDSVRFEQTIRGMTSLEPAAEALPLTTS